MLVDGLRPALGGVIAGSVLAVAAAQLIRSSLYATAARSTRPSSPL